MENVVITGDPDELQMLGRAVRAFLQANVRCDTDKADRALCHVLNTIGTTQYGGHISALVEAATTLVELAGPTDQTFASVVNALKFPSSALEDVDEELMLALQKIQPDMPDPEGGFWGVIEWLRANRPGIDFDAPPRRPDTVGPIVATM